MSFGMMQPALRPGGARNIHTAGYGVDNGSMREKCLNIALSCADKECKLEHPEDGVVVLNEKRGCGYSRHSGLHC